MPGRSSKDWDVIKSMTIFSMLSWMAAASASSPAPAPDGGTRMSDRFLTLEAITLPLVTGASASGRIMLTLTVEARDAEAISVLRQHMPRLRAGLVARAIEFDASEVSGFAAVDVSRLGKALNARPPLVPVRYRVLVTNVRTEPG